MKAEFVECFIFVTTFILIGCDGTCKKSVQANLLPEFIVYTGRHGTGCEWKIYTPSFSGIQLTVLSGSLGSSDCSASYIDINDGSGTSFASWIARVCNPSSRIYKSTGRYMTITYHARTTFRTDRFQLQYSVYDNSVCHSGYKVAQSQLSYISSPSFSGYNDLSKTCVWLIGAVNVNQKVLLEFVSLNSSVGEKLRRCQRDYVEVFDGSDDNSQMLHRWCGVEQPSLQSTGQYMYIRFHHTRGTPSLRFTLIYSSGHDSEIKSTKAGAIVGGVIAGVAVFIFMCCIVCACKRKKCRCGVPSAGSPSNTSTTNVNVNIYSISINNSPRSESPALSSSSLPSAPSEAPPPAYNDVVNDESLPPSYTEALEQQMTQVDVFNQTARFVRIHRNDNSSSQTRYSSSTPSMYI